MKFRHNVVSTGLIICVLASCGQVSSAILRSSHRAASESIRSWGQLIQDNTSWLRRDPADPPAHTDVWKAKKLDGHDIVDFEPLTCGTRVVAHGGSDKDARCPESCPFMVQDKRDNSHCTFECVKAEDCTSLNPQAPIADKELGTCRAPMIAACKEPMMNGEEKCKICKAWHYNYNGQCYGYLFKPLRNVALLVLAAVLVVVFMWILDLVMRPITNKEGLKDGLCHRARMTLHQPKMNHDDPPQAWPIRTNLLTTMVAGPGLMLHMNFQAAIILWGLIVAFVWMCFGWIVDSDLFTIGTRRFGTPWHNCILVQWGYHTQQELMWTKIVFLILIYILGCAASFLYSVYQLRKFQAVTWGTKTMGDFVAVMKDLPTYKGTDKPEAELKRVVEEATGQKVVGVSCAWVFQDDQEDIETIVRHDLECICEAQKQAREEEGLEAAEAAEAEAAEAGEGTVPQEVQPPSTPLFGWCSRRRPNPPTAAVAGPPPVAGPSPQDEEQQEAEEKKEEERTCRNPLTMHRPKLIEWETTLIAPEELSEHLNSEQKIREKLESLEGANTAFIVFETEEARDAAVGYAHGHGGIEYNGNMCRLRYENCEPDTVLWHNFIPVTMCVRITRVVKGVLAILLALLGWTVVFYLPYAFSIYNFNYENGNQPGFIYSMAFTVVVCAGNAIMYEVCARISDSLGFRYRDDREACYMILYTIACLCNVLMDFVTTYYMARQIMVSLGFRTVDGRALEEITSFTESFETYAMQRTLAENLYTYAWPSTFLIPFLIEPVATIIAPMLLGEWIVRSHPEIKGHDAEDWLTCPLMELGRYADIVLNLMLATLMFYFPGGFTHTIFIGMACAHAYIYFLDHTRILRSMARFQIATMNVDWWSQAMLAPILAIVPTCLVFKANCQGYGYCLEGIWLVLACSGAWTLHLLLHLAVLVHLVPHLGIKDEDMPCDKPNGNYKECNEMHACSWFTANPVHCLRSKFIYRLERPVVFCSVGKEHLLQINEEEGCYFSTKPPKDDDVGITDLYNSMSQQVLAQVSKMMSTSQDGGSEGGQSPIEQTEQAAEKSSSSPRPESIPEK